MEPLLHPTQPSRQQQGELKSDMLRYNSQTSTASASASIPTGESNDVEVAARLLTTPIEFSVNPSSLSAYSLWKRFLLSLLVFLIGWHIPKSLAPSANQLNAKDIPFQTLSSGDVVLDLQLNNPLVHPPTIPSNLLLVTSIWVPILIIAILSCCNNSMIFGGSSSNNSNTPWWKRFILHLSILLVCVGLSEGTTQLLKLYVLRRRPNFYELCQFDSKTRECTASYEKVLEAQMSFPSGHSSLSFCGMTFLSLYLRDQLIVQQTSNKSLPSASPTCVMLNRIVSLLPYSWALFVAASRVHDFWHFASDVIAGSLLGTWVSWWVWHNCQPLSE